MANPNLTEVPRISKHPEYKTWRKIIERCTNFRYRHYKYYGGRGIAVCTRWESFQNFCSDMGPKPSASHSIDRIDVNGDYCPENCRWSTPIEQARNKRNNRILECFGKSQCVAAWAEETGVPARTIHSRLKAGRSAEEALKSERRKCGRNWKASEDVRKRIRDFGQDVTLREICEQVGLSQSCVWKIRNAARLLCEIQQPSLTGEVI